MAHFIYLLIIAFLAFTIVKLARRSIGFQEDVKGLQEELDALEQGFSEVTDAYASDDAQWGETRQVLDNQISELQTELQEEKEKNARLYIDRNYQYNMALNNQMAVNMLQEELQAHTAAQRELQAIVDEHNEQCLPLISTVREITLDMQNFVDDLPPDCEQ